MCSSGNLGGLSVESAGVGCMYHVTYEHEIEYRDIYGKLLPILPMAFERNGHAFFHLMLVDTGADKIALPANSAERLGISLIDDCIPDITLSLGGQSEVYRYAGKIRMSIPDLDDEWFMECSVLFSPALDKRSYGLLGRECTLAHLAFGFHEKNGYHAFLLSLFS